MKAKLFIGLVFILSAGMWTALAFDSVQGTTSEATFRELNQMGCHVELGLTGAGIIVDRVTASGRITEDRMRTEPLPRGLFACLEKLNGLTSLHIDVKGGETDRKSLKELVKLPNLRHLELFGRDVNDDVLISVSSLTNLESLTLWDASVGDKGLSRLASLKALKRLEFGSFAKINRLGIEAVSKLRDLEYFRLYGEIEEGALSALSALPKLETVWIAGPRLNGMLGELKGAATIQRIEIARAEVDTAAAEHLRGMRNLKFLKLQCCSVTPEAVEIIQSLQLQQIECVGIATDVLSELAKGMPRCYGDLNVWN